MRLVWKSTLAETFIDLSVEVGECVVSERVAARVELFNCIGHCDKLLRRFLLLLFRANRFFHFESLLDEIFEDWIF